MKVFELLNMSITLPGMPGPEVGRHPAFTQDLNDPEADHEITREGLLVRIPAADAAASPQSEPTVLASSGDLRFEIGVALGTVGAFAARLDEGRVLWIERLDYARFEGRARLYYDGGRPISMSDDEYRARRRADHDEAFTEDHAVSALSPRATPEGGGVAVETRSGARFEVLPEGELALPKPGDEVRLYLSPGRTHDAPGEVVGVDLNGEPVYYEPPEEHARRSRRANVGDDVGVSRAVQAWSELGSRLEHPPSVGSSSAYGSTASEGTIFLSPEVRREAEHRQEPMEEATLRVQEETLRLIGHGFNLSHTAAPEHPPSAFLREVRRLDDERSGRNDLPPGGTAGLIEGEGRPVDPWTGGPVGEGEPEGR